MGGGQVEGVESLWGGNVRVHSHQQQHAAVLLDGTTAAQEAQDHDDDADGDHQVHARNRFIGQLRQTGGGRGWIM